MEAGAQQATSPPGLKALGLPLDERDVAALVHKSLSNMAGHNVHFRLEAAQRMDV